MLRSLTSGQGSILIFPSFLGVGYSLGLLYAITLFNGLGTLSFRPRPLFSPSVLDAPASFRPLVFYDLPRK
jgi:hypothetical protein